MGAAGMDTDSERKADQNIADGASPPERYRHVPIDRFTRDRAVDVHQILALGRGCL